MKLTRKTLGKVFALMLSFVLVLTNTVAGTLAFLSVNTSKVTNTFKPFDTAASNLIISKRVEHPLGEDYKIPDNISFDFKVSLGAYFSGYTFETTSGAVTADSQGNLNLSVKPNQAISIQGIDEGTRVTVTEIQDGGGFSVKGSAAQTHLIKKDEFSQAEFTNIYTPKEVTTQNITLKGSKTLTGRDFKDGDEFTFVLEMKDGEKFKAISEKTISYSDSADFNKFDFTDEISALTYDKIGAYTFRVFEKAGNLIGIDYDKTVNYFTINVTDIDMDGMLEIGSIDAEQNASVSGNFDITVDFNNCYTFPNDISVKIDVNKTIKNSGGKIGPEGFKFTLKGADKSLNAVSDKNGKAYFSLDYSYNDIGKSFEYSVSEVNDKRNEVVYCDDIYKLTVTISLSRDNKLIAEIRVNGKEYTDKSIVFHNLYKASSAPDAGEKIPPSLQVAFIILLGAVMVVYAYRRKRKNEI